MEHYVVDQLWDVQKLNHLVPNKECTHWTESDLQRYARFVTIEEAEAFYRCYATHVGFGIRLVDTKSHKNKEIGYRKWVCRKEGVRRERPEDFVRKREESCNFREKCKAFFSVSWRRSESCYRVIHFRVDHTHTLLTSVECRTLPSNSKMTSAQKEQARELANAGVRSGRIMDVIVNAAGGRTYVGFNIRSLYNFLYSDGAELVKDGDAVTMLTYIASKVQNGGDTNVYCKYTVDTEDRLCHLFWADSRSRQDYHRYRWVIAFDATYNTNEYYLPLVLIVGVNNHGQTVILGAALMRDESAASYTWLLETFMECMDVKKGPPLVITDSDPAMIKAIAEVWSDSLHRLCSWHILRNFQHHVASEGFKEVFRACMTKIKNEEEFEVMWREGIEEFELADNTWLQHMYEQRSRWVNHFFAPVFSAEQNTTQRCESINAYFKRWIDRRVTLTRLMMSFDEAVSKLRENELEQDVICKNLVPTYTRGFERLRGWEESGQKWYTREIWKKVLKEIKLHVALISYPPTVDEYETATYHVFVAGQASDSRVVRWNRTSQWCSCSCGIYVEMGIPCRHIFLAMKYEGIWEIPASIVLQRWTMNARNVEMPAGIFTPDGESPVVVDLRKVSRAGLLERKWMEVRGVATNSDEAFRMVMDNLLKLQQDCSGYTTKSAPVNGAVDFSNFSNIIRDPEVLSSRGSARPTDAAGKEKQGGRVTHCTLCKEPGHNKCKCQKKGKPPSQPPQGNN